MDFTLHIWRQKGPKDKGKLVTYPVQNISSDTAFLEMLEILNNSLEEKGEEPIAIETDCLEGICGCCSLVVNGVAHGPQKGITTCQLHMRKFSDGDHITIEPFRSNAFPVIKDLIVDRSAFDRIIQAGGYISVKTGGVPDANAILIPKDKAELAMDAAQCIGCGACVASCKNGSAMLFTAAKISQLAALPQGNMERTKRVRSMVKAMDEEGFGCCTNQYECEAVCPKEISIKFIAKMNWEYLRAHLLGGSK